MASTVFFMSDHGAKISPLLGGRGTTRVTGVSNWDFKNIDDATTAYSSEPITAGQRSYSRYGFLLFSGNFNMISGLTIRHDGGVLGAGLQILGFISGSGFYDTPATAAISPAKFDFTINNSMDSGVLLGADGPEKSGKSVASFSNPIFSEYCGFQLNTTSSAAAGDITSCVWNFLWKEN